MQLNRRIDAQQRRVQVHDNHNDATYHLCHVQNVEAAHETRARVRVTHGCSQRTCNMQRATALDMKRSSTQTPIDHVTSSQIT